MIGSIRGKIIDVQAISALVEVQGVGYEVLAAPAVLTDLTVGSDCFLYIHDVVREDARLLYGFLQRSDLELFRRLLTVSGVGPKVALAVLGAGGAVAVKHAIAQGDLTRLTSMPGVGKKTAQKIILELKGQLVEEASLPPGDAEAVDALVALGYPAATAREAVKMVGESVTDVSERIREALKALAK